MEITEKAFTYKLAFLKGHTALVNVSIPFHDKIGSYLALLEPTNCENPLFPPVIIQYRPALHEQHIHTNASAIPLRFHISSPDNHRLIIIMDPHCEYKVGPPPSLLSFSFVTSRSHFSLFQFW